MYCLGLICFTTDRMSSTRRSMRGHDAASNTMIANCRPARLLMTEILIRRYQELVTIRLGPVEQRTVVKTRPASLEGGIHLVSGQMPAQGCRHALIEQYSQATVSFRSRIS